MKALRVSPARTPDSRTTLVVDRTSLEYRHDFASIPPVTFLVASASLN